MKDFDKKWGGKRQNAGRKTGQPLKPESEKLSGKITFCVTLAEKDAFQLLSYAEKEELKKNFREGIQKFQHNKD